MFRKLYKNGYITEKTQEMAYCNDCERFLPDRYIEGECPHCGGLARGDQCDEQECGKLLEPEEIIDPYCTICENSNISFKETKNLYLQLSKFEDRLRNWMENGDHVPENVRKEVMNLIDEGLEDRCITRDISWGFEVPTEGIEGLDDEVYDDKVLYVWFDAPIGYIGITRQYFASEGDESGWKDFWRGGDAETVYSIGKDNTIFHTIIWPAVLMGQESDYNLPDYEFIHQFLLSGEVQFSKSRGTGLDGRTALDMLPADYWRYYLSSVLPVGHDSKFSWDDFEARINNELNDTIGNYVNRVLSLAEKWFDNKVPEIEFDELNGRAQEFLNGDEGVSKILDEYVETIEEDKNLRKGLKKAVSIARLGDEFLSETEPWSNPEIKEDVIFSCIQSLKPLSAALYPYIPDSAMRIWDFLDAEGDIDDGKDYIAEFKEGNFLESGKSFGEREILFEKVDAEELRNELENRSDSDEAEGDKDMSDEESLVSFEEFQKLDLRTATVKKVENHPNADRLYKIQLDFGDIVKQSCAGLKEHFSPEELEGRKVIAVKNLEPAELRGEKSEAMVLAVDTDEGEVVLIGPEKDVGNGLKVR